MQATETMKATYDISTEWARPTPILRKVRNEPLPKDPRQWTRDHVLQWLKYVCTTHGLPEVPSSRFVMNGKALCLMSQSMFLERVPFGGKLLYKDFQLRLCSALYQAE